MSRFTVTRLEDRATPAVVALPSFIPLVSGSGVGSRPLVQTYNADGTLRAQFLAFDAGFRGGVNVALADVTGDGVRDVIAAAGPGGGPHVKVFDGKGVNALPPGAGTPVATVPPPAVLSSFFAYAPGFTGGVQVAAGDVNADGFADIVTGAGAGGGPHVKAFSGKSGITLRSFFAFDPTFTGGVTVAVGRINTDIPADIVVGSGPGIAATVAVFDGNTASNFLSFTPYGQFAGGVNVGTGHVGIARLPGFDDIVTGAGPGAGPHVKVFTPTAAATPADPTRFTVTQLSSFFAFDAGFRGGVRVATADADGDGKADVVAGAGPGSDPAIRVFRGTNSALLFSFLKVGLTPDTPEYTSGVTLGGRFVDVTPVAINPPV